MHHTPELVAPAMRPCRSSLCQGRKGATLARVFSMPRRSVEDSFSPRNGEAKRPRHSRPHRRRQRIRFEDQRRDRGSAAAREEGGGRSLADRTPTPTPDPCSRSPAGHTPRRPALPQATSTTGRVSPPEMASHAAQRFCSPAGLIDATPRVPASHAPPLACACAGVLLFVWL